MVNPMTTIQKKGFIFELTNECEVAFIEPKWQLTSTPILRFLNMAKFLFVYMDVSELNKVWIQFSCKKEELSLALHKLMHHEIKYSHHDIELVTFIMVLKLYHGPLIQTKNWSLEPQSYFHPKGPMEIALDSVVYIIWFQDILLWEYYKPT